MKIIEINKFHWRKGGSEKAFFENIDLFRERGNEVAVFSMKSPENLPSEYDEYFVENRDFHHRDIGGRLSAAYGSVYSGEAREKLGVLIKKFRPQVAHIHNYMYHLTPSILYALRENGVPVVNTLHDFYLADPNYLLYDDRRNCVCEKCKGGRYYQAILNRCMKGSLLVSLLGALNSYYWGLKKSVDLIDGFIAPSSFMKQKLIEFGLDGDKIHVLPNFIDPGAEPPVFGDMGGKKGGDYIIYAGRLSPEKGIEYLLQAVRGLPEGISLYVAGSGPCEDELRESAADISDRVKFLGFQAPEDLQRYIDGALFMVAPSICYENFPYAVLEGCLRNKPVVGSRIGGIPEIIIHGETGFLVNPGDPRDLREKMVELLGNRDLITRMGKNARERVIKLCDRDAYYSRIMPIFEDLQGESGGG